MSTKTYVLTFAGAGMLPLPQGTFFMIKSAVAALSINAVRRDGQPVAFENVGAGLQYNGNKAGVKWYSLEVSSSVAQVVEIVISDDAEVSFANTVSVAGGVAMTETPSAVVATPARITRATAGATTIAANPARRRITICNPSDNATPGLLYVQAVGAGAGRGLPLDPGLTAEFKTTAALDVRNDSGVSVDFTVFEET